MLACCAQCNRMTGRCEKSAEYLLIQLADLRACASGAGAWHGRGWRAEFAGVGGGVVGRNSAFFVLACARMIAGKNIGGAQFGTDG